MRGSEQAWQGPGTPFPNMSSMSSDKEILRTGKLEGSVAACEGEGFEQPLQPHLSHFTQV